MPKAARKHRPFTPAARRHCPIEQVRPGPSRDSKPWMYGRTWRKARIAYLSRHPLCVECQALGRVRAATDVDHMEPHRGNWDRFWDESNWQALCKPHHSAKTAREDGGFGNVKRER